MRRTRKASFALFISACALVPAAAITACSDDDTGGGGGVTLLDGSAGDAKTLPATDGAKADAPTSTDSGNTQDVNQPPTEAGTDSGTDAGTDADAGTDSGNDSGNDAGKDAGPDADAATADADAGSKPTSIPDGTYKITAWTCTNAGGTKDVLAYSDTLGIAEIDQTFSGAAGGVDSVFKGAPACTRSSTTAIQYPQPGQLKITTSAAYTCSATCDPGKCTAGTQPITIDTYDFTTGTGTFTGTRTVDAAALNPDGSHPTLESGAGCAVGDTETATYTKK